MRVLQLCLKPPVPARDGGCIAMHNITRGLLALGHRVRILTIVTHKHPFDPVSMGETYMEQTDIQGVFVDTKVNLVDAFSSMITQDSYNISRFFSPDFDMILGRVLKEETFDVIHLESLFMTPYIGTIRRFSKASIVLRSHNLEHVIWERMASGTRNPAKRAYIKYLSKKLKEYETAVMHDVDGIAAISASDTLHFQELQCSAPVATIPFGIDFDHYQPELKKNSEISLFHIGAMDWTPNIEGIMWFIDEVWPLVKLKMPQVKLYLAGRGLTPDFLEVTDDSIVVVGEVESASAFMKSHDIMVVPLLTAGGIRVKTIEAMALAKAVVTTSIGLEGIDAEHGNQVICEDEPEAMAASIVALIQHPDRILQLGNQARNLVESHFDNKRIIDKLVSFYESIGKP
ncbi:MAG: hypothetical protein RL226_1581 [Bacteroidota bacterium]